MYDFKCPDCGTVFERLCRVGERSAPCENPDCLCAAERVWVTKPPAAIGDECDYIAENLGPTEIRIRSKAERRRIMKERGLFEMVRHVGVPGTDKSPHTTNWNCISAETLSSAKSMLERVGGIRRSEEQMEQELDHAVDSGEVEVGVPLSDGRTIGVRIGAVYSGVLDPDVLKR